MGTRRLIAQGCSKLAMISGSLQLELLANQRYASFVAEAEAAGVEHVVVETNLDVFDFSQYSDLVDRLFWRCAGLIGIAFGLLLAYRLLRWRLRS